jgi:PAS domain S-box-containing protein/putative nucleotidyltransferase with HDIG domain
MLTPLPRKKSRDSNKRASNKAGRGSGIWRRIQEADAAADIWGMAMNRLAGSGALSRGELLMELERDRERIAELEGERERSHLPWTDSLMQHLNDGVVLLGPTGVHLDVNPAFCAMTGFSREELIGAGIPHPYWPPEERDAAKRVLRHHLQGPEETAELTFTRKDGSCFPVLVTPSVIRGVDGEPVFLLAVVRDIGEQRRATEALQHLNRELQALTSCHQTLLRATDEETLLEEICRIACDEAGYRMAWVGYAEHDDAKRVRPVAWAGSEDGYLAAVDITWADSPRGRGPTGSSIRGGKTVYTSDLVQDKRTARWRKLALQHGYRSSIALPLTNEDGETFGALTIYAAEFGAFTPEEQRLLEELTNDLSFGITVLRARAGREQTEAALRESEAQYRSVVENAPVGIFQTTIAGQGQLVYVNPACAQMFGCASAAEMLELVNRAGLDVAIYQDSEERRRLLQDAHRAGGEWITFKGPLRRRSGSVHICLLYVCERRDPVNGELGLFGFVQDVTVQEEATKALERSMQLLSHGERLAHVGSWEMDIAADACAVSEEWQRLHGLEGSPLTNAVIDATCHEDDRQAVRDALAVAAGGGAYRVEHRIVRADTQEVRHLMSYGDPVLDADDHLERVIGASLDVTERVRADEALRERERRLRGALAATVTALGATVTMRDPYTAGHQRRVAELVRRIAERLGCNAEVIERLHTAALVHDVGKIAIPAELLAKPARLTETEFTLIKTHAQVGHDILAGIDFEGPVAEIVLQHHERLDGSGYPRGLKANEILPGARILAVADAVEAMVSHRPYRPALPLEEALGEITRGAGTRYDVDAVAACRQLFEEGFDFSA